MKLVAKLAGRDATAHAPFCIQESERPMPLNARHLLTWFVLLTLLVGIALATMGSNLPPADFTFVNETEVKSLDPAIVTGAPEGRIINSLFEGLVRWHPKTLEPLPGVAERWDISNDLTVFIFYLRKEARWSDGSPVTAGDFHYSLRRFLGPRTAAEYAYQGWYIKNAKRYSRGSNGIEPNDLVEVELNRPVNSKNTIRGRLLHGRLVSVENSESSNNRLFVVEIDGQEQRFYPTEDEQATEKEPPADGKWCRQVLLDFREVGVEVIDSQTLKITLENPTPYFLSLMGFYPMFPVNQKCVETYGSPQWTDSRNLVGNGPFQIQFRRIRDRIRLLRSETYWNRKEIQLGIVDALSIDAVTTAFNLYMTGKVDWVTEAPPPALRILLKEDPPRNDLSPSAWLSSYFYLINTTRKPLDDLRVRKALSLAIDREELVTKLLAAGEMPAFSLVPPGIAGYQPQASAPENADEARRLLAEAGYPQGKGFPRIDILYNTHEAHQSIAELIRKQWQQELGISVKTRNEEWASYLSSQRQKQYNICRRGWIGDYADPNTFLDMYVTNGEQNNTGWSSPEYDRLIEEARREQDSSKRMQMLAQAERLLMDDLPILPIYHYVSKNLVKPHVRGFYNNIQDFHPIWAIWIDRDSGEPNEFMRGQP